MDTTQSLKLSQKKAKSQKIFFTIKESFIESLLSLSSSIAVFVTVGIFFILIKESLPFFEHVSLKDFLTGTEWYPLFSEPKFGILPLLCGTLLSTAIAVLLALPLGTACAIYLSEYASPKNREILKPILELLAAVPTVVYGYFALLYVTPLLQKIIPSLPGFNILSAGLVMGIMIIPYVCSLSEDALKAVPAYLREASYALGSTRLQTAWRVLVPAASSGLTAAYTLAISRALGETMIVAIAGGMQPVLSANPLNPAQTVTTYIVQVSLGDLPYGSVGFQSIYAVGLTLLIIAFILNVFGFWFKHKLKG